MEEAAELRNAGIKKDILVLGSIPEQCIEEAIQNNISITLYSDKQIRPLENAAEKLKKKAKLHIKIETGMNRLGFKPDFQNTETIVRCLKNPYFKIEGVFTHFACADEDNTETAIQAAKFNWLLNEIKQSGAKMPIVHAANSPAIANMPEYYFDMVRAGLILTGFYTSESMNRQRVKVMPCITLRARIVNLNRVMPGEGIGYGHTYHTDKNELIATVPFGFSDGYPRSLSNIGYALLKGVKCPVRGNICMDQMMIDVKPGDELIFYGSGKDGAMTAEDAANMNKTIVDEILTGLSKRLPRVYRR